MQLISTLVLDQSLGVTSQQTTTHTASLITTDLIGIIQKTRSVIKAHTSKPDTLTLITDTRVERRLLRLVMGGGHLMLVRVFDRLLAAVTPLSTIIDHTSGVTLVSKVKGEQARGVLIKCGVHPALQKWGVSSPGSLKLRLWITQS